jgi:hypothetical protein
LVLIVLIWTGLLLLIGTAYRLNLPLFYEINMGAVLIMLYLPIGLLIGAATQEALSLIATRWQTLASRTVVGLIFVAGMVIGPKRVTDIESYRYFVTPPDLAAMEWIKANTPVNARFAINTYFWLPAAPHGTDAGYWIPYFTGRDTTAGAMLLSFASPDYVDLILRDSRASERLASDPAAIADLRQLGIDYIYVGANGNFSGTALDGKALSQQVGLRTVYHDGPVWVLEVMP